MPASDAMPKNSAPSDGHRIDVAAAEVATSPFGAGDPDALESSEHMEELQMLVKRLHREVMQKLEDQQVLLRRAMPGPPSAPVLFDSLAVAGSASSPSMTSSVMQEIIDNSSRSQEAAEGGTRKGDYHSEYGKVCTYTSFDMQLREGADSFSGTVSRKQFADIISTKHVQSEQPAERWTVTRLANHPYFDMFFGMVVLSNAVFIGADLQMRLSHNGVQPLSMRIVQYFYAFLFTCELILRVIAQGKRFLFSEDWMWSVLDIFIVMTSLWEVLAGILQDIADSEVGSIGGVSSLKAFRIIRLTRILKTVRVIRLFRFVLALRTLITSIFSTLKSLFWALMLLTLIVYVFAILFAQAINDHLSTPDAAPLDEVATERYFGDLTNTMLSLFMSIVGGVSWEEVIAPLKVISPIWVVLFLFYISFTYLAVLNVVTGVFCQSAIDSAQSDQAMMVQNILDDKQAHLRKINALFNQLGAESTGAITYHTFEEKLKSPAVQQYFQTLGLDVWDAWSFFKLLDQDAGGSVEIEEFLLGCLRLRGHATAIDVVKILQDQSWMIQTSDRFHKFVHEELTSIKSDLLVLSAASDRPAPLSKDV